MDAEKHCSNIELPFSFERLQMKGNYVSSMILSNRAKLKSPRRKKLAGLSTDRRAPNLTLAQMRVDFEYLIGQQRLQSMPQAAAKSRAFMLSIAKTMQRLLAVFQ
jgi:hypothetical protein